MVSIVISLMLSTMTAFPTTVTVMWPRTDEERARKRNCGFCSFKRRADAEEARSALHDYELDGHRMQVGWLLAGWLTHSLTH